jgi:hypothetical protein
MMSKEIDDLKDLHYKVMSLIKRNDWVKLNKLIKEVRYSHNPNKSKMVLVATQGLVENENILEERYLLYQWFNNDVGLIVLPVQTVNDPNVPKKYKLTHSNNK